MIRTRKGEELKVLHHASAAATRDNHVPYSQHWQLFLFMVAIHIQITQSSCDGASTRHIAVFCRILPYSAKFCQPYSAKFCQPYSAKFCQPYSAKFCQVLPAIFCQILLAILAP